MEKSEDRIKQVWEKVKSYTFMQSKMIEAKFKASRLDSNFQNWQLRFDMVQVCTKAVALA